MLVAEAMLSRRLVTSSNRDLPTCYWEIPTKGIYFRKIPAKNRRPDYTYRAMHLCVARLILSGGTFYGQ